MTKESKNLSAYRETITEVFHANMRAIGADTRFTAKERAGTATLCAVACMSHAAFLVGGVEPRLKNAPMEAQLDDFLTLLRGIMVEKYRGPQLTVVKKDATNDPR